LKWARKKYADIITEYMSMVKQLRSWYEFCLETPNPGKSFLSPSIFQDVTRKIPPILLCILIIISFGINSITSLVQL
jgi:hypothetical protein